MTKQRAWEILSAARQGDRTSFVFDSIILTLIFLNIIAVIIGTVAEISRKFGFLLDSFELFSVIVFTLEYFARLWSCTVVPQYSHPVFGRIKYLFSFMALVDLAAILPFYLPLINADFRFMRALRLFRLFRLAKLTRYVPTLGLFRRVFISKKEELGLSSLVMILMVLVSSSLMYYVESTAQPDKFPDIPSTMWWSVATLTTVGYGDVYPVTPLGKIFASIVAVLGIGVVALPTGLLSAGFIEELQKERQLKEPVDEHFCPHCGKPLH
ncbi:MAG TPA: ion transporter [Patescibacteria group bacterium]|nr:ion transporter [Patescibacteria group bacterium]